MLYLDRKPGEAILIGSKVKVVVSEMHDGYVTLGIAAPDYIQVDREERRERLVRLEKSAGPDPRRDGRVG